MRRQIFMAGFPPLVRRIGDGLRRTVRLGYRVKRIYLTAPDLAELEHVAPEQWRRREIGGLPIARTRSSRSRIHTAAGGAVYIAQRPPP